MLCSKCSEPVRPVVALDVDETLAQYLRHFLDFAGPYFNTDYRHDVWYGHEPLNEWMHITKEAYRTCKLAYRQGGMKRTMPVYPGAQMLFAKLVAVHAEIWITTTRPYMRLDNVDPDTREWLHRYGLEPYAGLLYDEDKYAALLERVDKNRVVGVVDDDPAQCARAMELGLAPIRPRRLQYQSHTDGFTVPHLKEAQKMLLSRIDHWEAVHAEQG